jgi:hypothetical protein
MVSYASDISDIYLHNQTANATGVYGGYSGSTGGGGGPPTGSGLAIPSGAPSTGAVPPASQPASASAPSGAQPSGSPGGGGGGPNGPSAALARNETFLRGGYFTDANGIVEITTLYPGFYEGRTAHIHAMVHTNWTQNANGSVHYIFPGPLIS